MPTNSTDPDERAPLGALSSGSVLFDSDISFKKALNKKDAVKKRKRTSSGGNTLLAEYVTENLHLYGEVILHCNVLITRGIRECGNTIVLKYVCALLNSGGGILHMRNMDVQRGVVLSKHLDTWWSGMEIKMAEILSRDDICNYFDLVGNHDDPDLYLFVKTAEHLCSLCYYCRLPTDTATHDVTYQSMLRLLVSHEEPGSLDDLPTIPQEYIFGRSASELKKETKQIQFKQLSSPQNRSPTDCHGMAEKIRSLMVKYVSAFANHEGGHIYFGIDDTRASVIGEELDQLEQTRTEALVSQRMNQMIWRGSHVQAVRGRHWDIRFCPVQRAPKKGMRRLVVVVSVCKFPGGVFTDCPDSTHVTPDGRVVNFTFDEWREAILNPLRDVPELHTRFTKLSLMVPRAPLVFTLPGSINNIINKVLMAKRGELQPRNFIENYAKPAQRESIRQALASFLDDTCICIGMQCWGLRSPLITSDQLICDVAIVTNTDSIHVVTFSTSKTPLVYAHAQNVAVELKTRLVLYGGLVDKFSVASHIVDITTVTSGNISDPEIRNRDIYPSHYSSLSSKTNKILRSLAICMATYRAKSHKLSSINHPGGYYFVLTHDQFELLWTQQFTKELWVHGPAGAGKTVAAIQLIQELRRRGCGHGNILYLAENEKLCEFVRSHNLCLVTTRRELLDPVQQPSNIQTLYSNVCNVIVDEVQNFKDRDGDWYSLAEKLANQKPANYLHRCTNYFWLFMDYSQKVHKFQAGLPSVIGKHNFMLSEVSRNTKEIFDFTSRLMMASENVDGLCSPVFQHIQSVPKLAHNYSSGKGVDILSCKEAEIKTLLNQVLTGLLQNGIHENDIAILVGKRTELDKVQASLSDIQLTEAVNNKANKGKNTAMETSRSVEEHLRDCGSDKSIGDLSGSGTVKAGSNDSGQGSDTEFDLEEDQRLDISNPFDVLSNSSSGDAIIDEEDIIEGGPFKSNAIVEKSRKHSLEREVSIPGDVKFYNPGVEDETRDSPEKQDPGSKQSNTTQDNAGFDVDTVRGFSGLDKAAVIGINPSCNEDHADFKKFLLSLATRARDNLVIITTSDTVKQKLEECTHS